MKNKRPLGVYFIYLVAVFIALTAIFSVVVYLIPLPTEAPSVTKEDLASPNGHFIEVDGTQLYYEEFTTCNCHKAVVLVHGFGGSTISWRDNVQYFADQNYRVIAVDLLGYGLSDKDYASDYSHAAHAERLNVLLEKLNVQQAAIVGHSMGGSVALQFAHLYPEKVTALVLVDPAISLKGQGFNIQQTIIPRVVLAFPPFRRTAQLALRAYLTSDRAKAMLQSAYGQGNQVSGEALKWYTDRNAVGDWDLALLASTRDMSRNEIDFSLSEITQPTLIISGDHDVWVPTAKTERLAPAFPNAQFVLIKDAGHLPMEEQPAAFNKAVLEFFKK